MIQMVASKRCKICSTLDAENVPISGEYFGKILPDIILKVSGVELDPRKANGVLICKPCTIQLLHAEVIIDKLRHTLQRLKKFVKETKPKTPLKNLTAVQAKTNNGEKKMNLSNVANDCQDKVVLGEINSIANVQKLEAESEVKSTTPKKRRKSVFPDDTLVNTKKEQEQCKDTLNNGPKKKFQKLLDKEGTLIKNTPTKSNKQKQALSENGIINNDKNINHYNSDRISEGTPMNLTVDEDNGNDLNNDSNFKESKVKTLNCVICGKAFNEKILLRDHIEASHMGEKLKECPHCSKEFRSQQKYDSHVFSEKCKNSKHACQYPKCNKRFKTVHKMELHMQEKHSMEKDSKIE